MASPSCRCLAAKVFGVCNWLTGGDVQVFGVHLFWKHFKLRCTPLKINCWNRKNPRKRLTPTTGRKWMWPFWAPWRWTVKLVEERRCYWNKAPKWPKTYWEKSMKKPLLRIPVKVLNDKQLVVSKSLRSLQGFVEAYPRCGCSRSSGKWTWLVFFFTQHFAIDVRRLVSWYWDPSLRPDHGQFYEEDAQPYGATSFHTFFLGWAVSTFWDGACFTLFFITCVNIRTYSLKIFLSVPSQPRPKIAWRPLITWIFTNEEPKL